MTMGQPLRIVAPLAAVVFLALWGLGCEAKVADPLDDQKPEAALLNARCPMMGSPIKADSVPETLTRAYEGGTVGFCCGKCPAEWDKLSDADKAAKLAGGHGGGGSGHGHH